MSFISLGAIFGVIAVAITALGGTTMYPWIFLGFLVMAGLIYAIIYQRRQALEAQIQSNRQMTINFIYNQYQTAVQNYATLIKPYESSEAAGIPDIVEILKAEYDATQRLYDDLVHLIQCSNDPSVFESIKNKFTSNSTLFQQNLTVKNEQIKQKLKEEEIKNQQKLKEEELKNQKLSVISDHDKKRHDLEIRFRIIFQNIPTSSEDVLDFEKMTRELDNIDLEKKWTEYNDVYENLKKDYLENQDPRQEHKCIGDIATLSSDFSKSLDDLKSQVENVVKRFAKTDEGRLARSIKEKSTIVPSQCFHSVS